MKIIVIGAKGMLGQDLIKTFDGNDVLAWDLDEIDITQEDGVLQKISAEKPHVVLNAAAFNDVDGAETKPEVAMKVNRDGPKYLAKAVHRSGGTLVHYSTGYVFRGDKKEGYSEEDDPDPQSVYARSKYEGELEVQKHGRNFYLIRLARLFGKPAASALGKKSFVELMLDLAAKRDTIEVVDDELSSAVYSVHLAHATRRLLEDQPSFGIYHLVNEGAGTWYDFAKEIFTIQGIDVTIQPVSADRFPRPAPRPHYAILRNTKAQKLPTWQEALSEYLSL